MYLAHSGLARVHQARDIVGHTVFDRAFLMVIRVLSKHAMGSAGDIVIIVVKCSHSFS